MSKGPPEFEFNWYRVGALAFCVAFWAVLGYGCAYTLGWVR